MREAYIKSNSIGLIISTYKGQVEQPCIEFRIEIALGTIWGRGDILPGNWQFVSSA